MQIVSLYRPPHSHAVVRILLNFLTRTDFNSLRDQLTNTNRRSGDSNMLGGHVPTRQNWSAM